jgi:hypothetical protein
MVRVQGSRIKKFKRLKIDAILTFVSCGNRFLSRNPEFETLERLFVNIGKFNWESQEMKSEV